MSDENQLAGGVIFIAIGFVFTCLLIVWSIVGQAPQPLWIVAIFNYFVGSILIYSS